MIIFVGRNLIRLNKEINFYNYNLLESPYFFIERNEPSIIYESNDFKIYTPAKGKMVGQLNSCSYTRK